MLRTRLSHRATATQSLRFGSIPLQELIEYRLLETVPVRSLRDLWRRCIEDPANPDVWPEFLLFVRPILLGIARRVASQWGVKGHAEIEDLFQEICLKISQRSPQVPLRVFESDGSSEAYLRAMATNAAHDVLRGRFAGKRAARLTLPLEDHTHELVSALGPGAMDRQVFFREIDEMLEGSARDRAVFWLYYRQGLTAKEISQIPFVGLGDKGVESLILRMISALRTCIFEEGRGASSRPAGDKAHSAEGKR